MKKAYAAKLKADQALLKSTGQCPAGGYFNGFSAANPPPRGGLYTPDGKLNTDRQLEMYRTMERQQRPPAVRPPRSVYNPYGGGSQYGSQY